jgi:hypothetical protein
MYVELKSSEAANCLAQDDTSILKVTSTRRSAGNQLDLLCCDEDTLPGIPSWRSPEKTATATTDGPFGAPPLFPFPVGESENAEIAAAPDIRFKRTK